MPLPQFEYQDDLSEVVEQVRKRLSAAGVDEAMMSLVGLDTLRTLLKNRDDDLASFLNSGLLAAVHEVSATTGTVVATATPTALVWEAEPVDSSGDVTWDSGSNPTRVTYSEGLWLVTANIAWAATATGARGAEFRKNGSAFAPAIGDSAPASTAVTPCNSFTVQLSAATGDYLEVWCNQDSGTNKTATGWLDSAYLGSVG